MLLALEKNMLASVPEVESRAPAPRRAPPRAADGPDLEKVGAGETAIDPRPAIRRYILENFLFSDDHATLPDDASFLELGIIDSVGALEIALFLEQTFGFAVKENEMLPENLDSVDRLVRFVESRRQGV